MTLRLVRDLRRVRSGADFDQAVEDALALCRKPQSVAPAIDIRTKERLR